MEKVTLIIKILKKIYGYFFNNIFLFNNDYDKNSNVDYSNNLIKSYIISGRPFMAARLGGTELTCVSNYISIKNKLSLFGFITGKNFLPWWDNKVLYQMKIWSGFFSNTPEMANRFSELMIKECRKVDILASYSPMESFLKNELESSIKISFFDFEPFFCENPWTIALKNKKVLVIHPFKKDIENQYKIRSKLFEKDLLPDFELIVYQSVQSLNGSDEFNDWFEALNHMKVQISKIDFDIAIIGCGAYGFPLASFVKEIGKQSIHLGGVTQMLFGIKGNRWESSSIRPFKKLINEYWIKPSSIYKPSNANKVEDSCYW